MVIKKIALVLTTLLIGNTTWADSYLKEEKTTNFIVTPSVAYRYDVFQWSIPSDRFPHNKLSELVWKNHIVQPSIKLELEPQPYQFTFLGQVKYGYILKNNSKSWDKDWHHDNQGTKLYSKTLSSVKGNILDFSGAIGYSFYLLKNSLLTFYLGYDYTDYRNKNYGDKQLAYKTNFSFSSGGLGQKYYFKTYSPWVGVSVNTPLSDKFSIIPTIKFYSFKYIGKGYWIYRPNLKQDPSFKQNAKGTGLGFNVDFVYKYSDNLDFEINLETKKFKMRKGTDQLFYNAQDIGGERVYTGKLYNLSLLSSSISVGLKYKL
jgi:hypothetical protein